MTAKSFSLATEGKDSSHGSRPPQQLDLAAFQRYARIPFLDQAAAATPSRQPYHIIVIAVQRLPHRTTNYNHLLPCLHPIPKSALISAQPISIQTHRAFTSPSRLPRTLLPPVSCPTPYPGWELHFYVDHNTRSTTWTHPSPHLSAPIPAAH
ncbi:hypothetical protein BJY52DRAFT_1417785, partial [Lactarius psammicola]